MGGSGFDVKLEVTVNGSGFDTPSEVNVNDSGEIPTGTMIFPAGMNSRYKLLKSDILRVYLGLDELPDYPTFTCHLDNEIDKFSTRMDIVGSLNRAIDDQRFVTDYDNFDGLELGNAMQTVFSEVSELSWMNAFFESTSPLVRVPQGLRFNKGLNKYDLMKQFKMMAADVAQTIYSGYALFQHGDDLQFRKTPDPDNTDAAFTLAYGDSLLDFQPESAAKDGYNYARVVGNDGIVAEYMNDHRVAVDSLKEMKILIDKGIPNAAEAYETARANVLNSLFSKNPMKINSHKLIDAVPNYHVVEIEDAPFGLSDNYLIKSKTISASDIVLMVQCKVTTPHDILSEMLTQLLSLSNATETA